MVTMNGKDNRSASSYMNTRIGNGYATYVMVSTAVSAIQADFGDEAIIHLDYNRTMNWHKVEVLDGEEMRKLKLINILCSGGRAEYDHILPQPSYSLPYTPMVGCISNIPSGLQIKISWMSSTKR